jgi:restriction endonuclease S subunit
LYSLALKTLLKNIASLLSGLYTQSNILADTLYLQGVHFNEYGDFSPEVKPQIKLDQKTERHLLQNDDVLFAAKGLNNFAVVYKTEIGKAVASTSFIIIRLNKGQAQVLPQYLAWYLTYNPEVKLFHKQLGTTIPSISISTLSELEIEIPSLERQHQVVAIQTLRNREKKIVHQLEQYKDQFIKYQLLAAVKQ